MAKKNSDTIFKDYLAELEAINPGLKDILADERVSAKLKEGVLARSDYSAQMDSLRTERESFATEVAEARQKIAGWQSWYGTASTEVAGLKDKLTKYEDTYGELEAGNAKAAARMGVSKEELNTLLESRTREHDLAAIKFADHLTDIKIDFRDRFKEKLDTEAVFKLAGEKQVDLTTAYNLHIADRVEEMRTKDVDERIKQARADAVSEYASKHNLPVMSNDSVMTHVLDSKDVATTPQSRVAAALAGMNASRAGR